MALSTIRTSSEMKRSALTPATILSVTCLVVAFIHTVQRATTSQTALDFICILLSFGLRYLELILHELRQRRS
jgi:hypothetical protein